jgi:chromosome segregation ATPase
MNAYTVSAPDNITVFGDTRIRELERIVRNQSEEIILLKKKRDELNKSVEKVTTLQAQLVERDVEIHKLNLESLKEYKIRIEMSHKIETLETRNQSIDRLKKIWNEQVNDLIKTLEQKNKEESNLKIELARLQQNISILEQQLEVKNMYHKNT